MFDSRNLTMEYKYFKQLAKDDMWFKNSDRFKSFVRASSVKKKSNKKGRGGKK